MQPANTGLRIAYGLNCPFIGCARAKRKRWPARLENTAGGKQKLEKNTHSFSASSRQGHPDCKSQALVFLEFTDDAPKSAR
jgi:hypothetical protein